MKSAGKSAKRDRIGRECVSLLSQTSRFSCPILADNQRLPDEVQRLKSTTGAAYPPEVIRAIYSITRRMWKQNQVEWSRPLTGTELVRFVNVLNTVRRTIETRSP